MDALFDSHRAPSPVPPSRRALARRTAAAAAGGDFKHPPQAPTAPPAPAAAIAVWNDPPPPAMRRAVSNTKNRAAAIPAIAAAATAVNATASSVADDDGPAAPLRSDASVRWFKLIPLIAERVWMIGCVIYALWFMRVLTLLPYRDDSLYPNGTIVLFAQIVMQFAVLKLLPYRDTCRLWRKYIILVLSCAVPLIPALVIWCREAAAVRAQRAKWDAEGLGPRGAMGRLELVPFVTRVWVRVNTELSGNTFTSPERLHRTNDASLPPRVHAFAEGLSFYYVFPSLISMIAYMCSCSPPAVQSTYSDAVFLFLYLFVLAGGLIIMLLFVDHVRLPQTTYWSVNWRLQLVFVLVLVFDMIGTVTNFSWIVYAGPSVVKYSFPAFVIRNPGSFFRSCWWVVRVGTIVAVVIFWLIDNIAFSIRRIRHGGRPIANWEEAGWLVLRLIIGFSVVPVITEVVRAGLLLEWVSRVNPGVRSMGSTLFYRAFYSYLLGGAGGGATARLPGGETMAIDRIRTAGRNAAARVDKNNRLITEIEARHRLAARAIPTPAATAAPPSLTRAISTGTTSGAAAAAANSIQSIDDWTYDTKLRLYLELFASSSIGYSKPVHTPSAAVEGEDTESGKLAAAACGDVMSAAHPDNRRSENDVAWETTQEFRWLEGSYERVVLSSARQRRRAYRLHRLAASERAFRAAGGSGGRELADAVGWPGWWAALHRCIYPPFAPGYEYIVPSQIWVYLAAPLWLVFGSLYGTFLPFGSWYLTPSDERTAYQTVFTVAYGTLLLALAGWVLIPATGVRRALSISCHDPNGMGRLHPLLTFDTRYSEDDGFNGDNASRPPFQHRAAPCLEWIDRLHLAFAGVQWERYCRAALIETRANGGPEMPRDLIQLIVAYGGWEWKYEWRRYGPNPSELVVSLNRPPSDSPGADAPSADAKPRKRVVPTRRIATAADTARAAALTTGLVTMAPRPPVSTTVHVATAVASILFPYDAHEVQEDGTDTKS